MKGLRGLRAFVQSSGRGQPSVRAKRTRACRSNGCLGDYFLYETECLQAQARRYNHPTEVNFFGPLPEPMIGRDKAPEPNPKGAVLAPHSVSINKRLLETYRTLILPEICEEGDDGNYGSTAVQDVHCLQTIATRIYYGARLTGLIFTLLRRGCGVGPSRRAAVT